MLILEGSGKWASRRTWFQFCKTGRAHEIKVLTFLFHDTSNTLLFVVGDILVKEGCHWITPKLLLWSFSPCGDRQRVSLPKAQTPSRFFFSIFLCLLCCVFHPMSPSLTPGISYTPFVAGPLPKNYFLLGKPFQPLAFFICTVQMKSPSYRDSEAPHTTPQLLAQF